MKKKIISSLLALLLLFTCSLPVYGAQTSKEMSSALQKKYGMNITFVTNYTESEKLTLLEQLDSILSHLGATFVRGSRFMLYPERLYGDYQVRTAHVGQ